MTPSGCNGDKAEAAAESENGKAKSSSLTPEVNKPKKAKKEKKAKKSKKKK